MALEPAGVSLEAENFNKYLGQLGKIDELQQDIFDVDSGDLDKALNNATKAAKKYEKELSQIGKESKKTEASTKGIGLAATGAAGIGIAAILNLTDTVIDLGIAATSIFIGIVKEGVELNKQFELTEKVFTNVFDDPNLGKATVDFLNETADGLRISRKEAARFAQTILPKSGGLDKFTELLRLTDIQADTTGQSIGELEFSIREALSGDFVSLKDRFDLGTDQINKIRELTPALGPAQALITVITDEFTRLGKTDISGTLSTNIKDLQSQFTNLQSTIGKPTFDILKIQTDELLKSLDRNREGINRTAIALGEVTSNIVELIGTGIIEFLDSLNFTALEEGVTNANKFVEALRVIITTVKAAFETGIIQIAFGTLTKNTNQLLAGFAKIREADFGQAFKDISESVNQASERHIDYKKRVDETANSQSNFTDANRATIDALLGQSEAAAQSTKSLQAYQTAIKQAEALQLSFGRAAEDSARKIARANEDIARKQAAAVIKLEEKQASDRTKLLADQQKELDRFEDNRRKEIAKAEQDIRKVQAEAGEQRKRDQRKLQRELAKEQERFNLSQLQSTRRFDLQESRLRAEGDILGLKELREDFALTQTEEKENFDQGQKDRVQSAEETQREQAKDLKKQLAELKSNLEDQRAELLKSFDEQVAQQAKAQAEATELQKQKFRDDAAERAIALERDEEDRRISQARQLEDLGRSFAEQEGVTEEGTKAIAAELEKVFGQEGVADTIFAGFTARTESEFRGLFDNVEQIVSDIKTVSAPIPSIGGFGGSRIGGLSEFDHGGVVPGPIGSPQVIQAHGGETVLPTHKQSFQMAAPVIPAQNLDVAMSGGFNITGGEQAGEAAVQAAVVEMTENFQIAVRRLARRN